jgi:hypothetical protein
VESGTGVTRRGGGWDGYLDLAADVVPGWAGMTLEGAWRSGGWFGVGRPG